jgi:hypothetical protein
MVHENGFNRLVGCFCRHIGIVSQEKSTMEIWQHLKPHGRDQLPQKHWHEVYLMACGTNVMLLCFCGSRLIPF